MAVANLKLKPDLIALTHFPIPQQIESNRALKILSKKKQDAGNQPIVLWSFKRKFFPY